MTVIATLSAFRGPGEMSPHKRYDSIRSDTAHTAGERRGVEHRVTLDRHRKATMFAADAAGLWVSNRRTFLRKSVTRLHCDAIASQ